MTDYGVVGWEGGCWKVGMVSRNQGAGLNGGRKAGRDVLWLEVGSGPPESVSL